MEKCFLSTLFFAILCTTSMAENNETLSKFTDDFPNIIMGEVYYVTQTSFLISVDLEFKGNMEAQTFETVFDGMGLKAKDVKVGQKVLVFINKLQTHPIDLVPYASFRLTKFDQFHGQCAYRLMNSDLDNDFLSQLTSVIYQKQLAAVYTY